ncbi:MAG: serine/threonine protein kinase [Planctomycetes bacterium]|nr:serine/threonine protein kinase [Planctomycetota bacterium]
MLEIPDRIRKKIKGYSKPQKVFRTNSEHILCWKTTRLEDKNQAVIKLFDWEVTEQIKAEYKAIVAIKKITHKNLVRVYDIKEDEELGLYYVMEYWGEDLRESFKYLPRQEQTIDIIKQVLEGLSELHKKVGPHRDIKPENIFIKDGQVKIGDYGLVKSKRFVTELTTVAGTHGYMAPEVLAGKPYDERCDIYSTGIVLLELLTGQRDNTNLTNRDKLTRIILKAVDKNPGKRYQTAEEFIGVLSHHKDAKDTEIIPAINKRKRKHKRNEPIVLGLARGGEDLPVKEQPEDILVKTLLSRFEELQTGSETNKILEVGNELLSRFASMQGLKYQEVYIRNITLVLAKINYEIGNFKKAEQLYQKCYALDVKLFGEYTGPSIFDLCWLGNSYLKQKRWELAIQNYLLAQQSVEKHDDSKEEKNSLAIILNNLATTYYLWGKKDIAQRLYQKTQEQLRENQPDDTIAVILYNLALTYSAMGNESAAEPLYKQALEIAAKTMKPDDERLAIIRGAASKG